MNKQVDFSPEGILGEAKVKEVKKALMREDFSDYVVANNSVGSDDPTRVDFEEVADMYEHFVHDNPSLTEVKWARDNDLTEENRSGKKVKLDESFNTPGGPTDYAMYVKNKSGRVVRKNIHGR